MMCKDFEKAVAEGKDFMMKKYKCCGSYTAPKKVSAEVALKKSKVVVYDYDGEGHCPYAFEIEE